MFVQHQFLARLLFRWYAVTSEYKRNLGLGVVLPVAGARSLTSSSLVTLESRIIAPVCWGFLFVTHKISDASGS